MALAVSGEERPVFQGKLMADRFSNFEALTYIKRIIHEVQTNPDFKQLALEMLGKPQPTDTK